MTAKEEANGYIKRGWPTSAVKMSEEVLRLSEENVRLRNRVEELEGRPVIESEWQALVKRAAAAEAEVARQQDAIFKSFCAPEVK